MSIVWRCPECETMNQDEKCVVCGYVNRNFNLVPTDGSVPASKLKVESFEKPKKTESEVIQKPHKTNKKPIVIGICFAIIGIIAVCIFLINKNGNNSPHVESDLISYDETTSYSSELSLPMLTNNDNTESQAEETFGVLEYHSNGKIKCEKTKLNENGEYILMWYDPDGSDNKREYYNSNDTIYKVDTCLSGVWCETDLELTENGYILTVARPDSKYPFMKYAIDFSKGRSAYRYIYCDSNKNELFWKAYSQEFYDDGSRKSVWRTENGDLDTVGYYEPDGSHQMELYENNKLKQIKSYDKYGEVIQTVSYDESQNIKQVRNYLRDGSYVVDFYKDGSVYKSQMYDKDGNKVK